MKPVVAKIAVPTMFETTNAVALKNPNCRSNVADLRLSVAIVDIITLSVLTCYISDVVRIVAWYLLSLFLLRAEDPYAPQRNSMVREQMEARGIRNPSVLSAMRSVPRHLFVPEALRNSSYSDHALPIGNGQTISQPYIVSLMTELLEPAKTHRVLEIGTGSGYQAAVLSKLVKHVYTIEIVADLAKSAEKLLGALGYRNVTIRHGDGYLGWPEQAPYDSVLLTAAPPEIPQALLNQLKPGGKLVAPVGIGPYNQKLIVMDKGMDGKIRERVVTAVMFVPMVPGAGAPRR